MAKRKQHTAAFKAQVALAALKGDQTVNEVAAQFGVHPTLIHDWKKKLLAGAAGVFEAGAKAAPAADAHQAELFEQIGRLKMELEWVKKTRTAIVTGRAWFPGPLDTLPGLVGSGPSPPGAPGVRPVRPAP